jgi:hypothetical protein
MLTVLLILSFDLWPDTLQVYLMPGLLSCVMMGARQRALREGPLAGCRGGACRTRGHYNSVRNMQ